MNTRIWRAAGGSAGTFALCLALAACGGGGGGGDPGAQTGNTGGTSDTTASSGGGSGNPTTSTPGSGGSTSTDPGTGTGSGSGSGSVSQSNGSPSSNAQPSGLWQLQRVGSGTNQLFPGNVYQPIGGEYPYALWLGPDNQGGQALYRADVDGAKGVVSTVLQQGLPPQAGNNTSMAVTAGAWSLVVWSAYGNWTGTNGQGMAPGLYVRLVGLSYDSGPVRVSSSTRVTAWDTRPMVDAQGHARLFWDEEDEFNIPLVHQGRNGMFVDGRWVAQPDANVAVAMPLQRVLVTPAGEGWLLQPEFSLERGRYEHQARRLTAAQGLSAPWRLDEQGSDWGLPYGHRLASADGTDATSFTTVGLQLKADGTRCLAVRQMVKAVLQPTTCVAATGDATPNLQNLSLATAPTGEGLLVWSTGANNTALYAARRAADGTWGAPARLAALPSDSSFDSLSGLSTAMGPQGQALVVWRVIPAAWSRAEARATTATAQGDWTTPVTLNLSDLPDHANARAAIAFNNQGQPGVLQQTLAYNAAADRYDGAVLMSVYANGQWTTRSLAHPALPPYMQGTPLGLMRLAPQVGNGWLAMWDQGGGPGDNSGTREFWVAETH